MRAFIMLNQKFNELKKLLLKETGTFYGDRLVTLAVYGSVARKTQGYYSDLDILIIADRLPDGRMNRVKEFDEVEGEIHPFIQKM